MVGKPDRKGSRHFNGHPAEIAALTLSHLGLMNGYADGTFRPDNTITRAEFAAVVSRAFKRGPGDGRFGSEAPLKEEDAVKMVVEALGYENIADDYFKAKKRIDEMEADMDDKDKAEYDLKHELISAQVQIEDAGKEISRLRDEIAEMQKQIVRLEASAAQQK